MKKVDKKEDWETIGGLYHLDRIYNGPQPLPLHTGSVLDQISLLFRVNALSTSLPKTKKCKCTR